jgi:very-short-patch-repair endonuclease
MPDKHGDSVLTRHGGGPQAGAEANRGRASFLDALLDLAATGEPIERLVAKATAKRLTSIVKLKAYVERRAGARGARKLRGCIEARQTRSTAEKELVECWKAATFRSPSSNEPFGAYTLDGIWPAQRLVVEIDTFETHGTRHSFEWTEAGWRAGYAASLRQISASERFSSSSRTANAVATRSVCSGKRRSTISWPREVSVTEAARRS